MRSAERHKSHPGEIEAAAALVAHSKANPHELLVAISAVTTNEFAANIDTVDLTARRALRSLRTRLAHADAVAGHLGLPQLSTSRTAGSTWDDDLVDRARRLTESWLSDALELDTSDDDLRRAHARTNARIPPGKQGSSATHDCIIVERAMREASVRQPGTTWLISSNTNDFAPDGGRLDQALVVEFAARGLEFATTWSEVRGRLGL